MTRRHKRGRVRGRSLALLVALGVTAGATLAGTASADAASGTGAGTVVATGVSYRRYDLRAAAGTTRAHVLDVDLANPHVRLGLLYPGAVAARAAVSAMADRQRAVAGVNGDFFDISEAQHPGVEATGSSVGPAVANGRALKGAVPAAQRFGPVLPPGTNTGAVVGVGTDGRARTDALALDGSYTAGGRRLALGGVNQFALPENSVGAFTSDWGGVSRRRATCGTDSDRAGACSARTYEVTLRRGRVVSASATPGSGTVTAGTTVLVGREAGAQRLKRLVEGERVTVRYGLTSASGAEYAFAVGGYPVLSGGAPLSGLDGSASAVRTAVGIAADGRRVFLLALDGAAAYRRGLTVAEVAAALRGLGASEGFSLDGGGSSTLVARRPGAARVTVRNHPSDGAERPVPNGIGVFIR
ncbi:phosphodiester glycosidase family protein [Streptomyces scabiei]|uniref:phosphodiester glycosidase family protein n=1 Tax=Streptomyces scabiei TaxID=1930 RepID=UPI0029BDDD20|nr:phosphodiester glycosidase family protein [Streptomyces scabiei]MDX3116428.1 phosphodiester glycosidase family protein [Streptomyces scabiei]